MVEAKHQSGPFRRAAADPCPQAKQAVAAVNAGLAFVDMFKHRIENQTAISEHPNIRTIGIIGQKLAPRGQQFIFAGDIGLRIVTRRRQLGHGAIAECLSGNFDRMFRWHLLTRPHSYLPIAVWTQSSPCGWPK